MTTAIQVSAKPLMTAKDLGLVGDVDIDKMKLAYAVFQKKLTKDQAANLWVALSLMSKAAQDIAAAAKTVGPANKGFTFTNTVVSQKPTNNQWSFNSTNAAVAQQLASKKLKEDFLNDPFVGYIVDNKLMWNIAGSSGKGWAEDVKLFQKVKGYTPGLENARWATLDGVNEAIKRSTGGKKLLAESKQRIDAANAAWYAEWHRRHPSKTVFDDIAGAVSWAGNALVSAGRAVSHAVASGINSVADLAALVPLIGPALHATLSVLASPFTLADGVLSGERLDHVLIADFNNKISAIREVGPMAQLIVSVVPGIGTGAAAAIAAGMALANGQPITEALMAGVKGALPGGAAVSMTFDVTAAAVRGDNVLDATYATAMKQLPATAQSALRVVAQAAKGGNIAKAAMNEAISALPSIELQQAAQVAMAVGQGQNVQAALTKGVASLGSVELGKLAAVGANTIAQTDAFKAGRDLVTKTGQRGYDIGMGLMTHTGVNETTLLKIRDKMSPAEKIGYDAAVSAYHGMVIAKKPAPMPPKAQAAYYTTHGLQGGSVKQKTDVMKQLVKDPIAKQGAKIAIIQIAEVRKLSWWQKVIAFFKETF